MTDSVDIDAERPIHDGTQILARVVIELEADILDLGDLGPALKTLAELGAIVTLLEGVRRKVPR